MGLFGRKAAVVGDHIQTLLENLCHLEINTIINDNITGRKMPVPEEAFVELACDYDRKLVALGAARGPDEGPVTGGPKEYQRLYDRALGLEKVWSAELALDPVRSANLVIVSRIRQTSEQILRIFTSAAKRQAVGDYTEGEARDHPIELLPDEIVVLRKAWELGIEDIVLQTVIQLDGDVIHRVQRQYSDGQHADLLAIHDMAIRTSVTYWKTLVDLVGEFAGGVGRLFGSRG
jgi:hypothetical protein